jgi:hypothetical protein
MTITTTPISIPTTSTVTETATTREAFPTRKRGKRKTAAPIERPFLIFKPLEHDPEKWVPVFPRDKREAFARRSCSNKNIERDDDSKKSHPALAQLES